MIRTITTASIGLFLSALWLLSPANAGISIIATVNGKPITNYDVEQRALFLGMRQISRSRTRTGTVFTRIPCN